MKLINYLKQNYPNGEATNWKDWVIDNCGNCYPSAFDFIDELINDINPNDNSFLNKICNYYIDYEKLENDMSINGDFEYIDNLNLENDEVNEFGELI